MMSITTTYKCDKCGVESTKATQFRNIGVFVTDALVPMVTKCYNVKLSALWCDKCLEEHYITKEQPIDTQPEQVLTNTQKLAAILEDLIQDSVDDAVENR